MDAVREKWTDGRLDDLNERVNLGFARVDSDIRDLKTEMSARFDAVDRRFEAIDAKFDALHTLLIRAAGGAIAVLVTTGAALVATQL
jgi:hypothetical protein